MEKTEEQKVKYGFGLTEDKCFTDEFDTVEELIAFAQDAHDNPDGNYWDEDWDEDEYPHTISVGIIRRVELMDIAPSLFEIADQMTDRLYCEFNVNDDCDVSFSPREESNEAWKAFLEKYCDLPFTHVCDNSLGIYDLKEHRWKEK